MEPNIVRYKKTNTIKTITYNIFSSNQGFDTERTSKQIDMLKRYDPDVICLQEVWEPAAQNTFINAFPDYIPVNAKQMLSMPTSSIEFLAPTIHLVYALFFVLLPSLLRHPILYTVGYMLSFIAINISALIFPPSVVTSILAIPIVLGINAGCTLLNYIFSFLMVLCNKAIFTWFTYITNLGSITMGLAKGDPFGLLILARADKKNARISPIRCDFIEYKEQAYLLKGSPWLFWAGWFEGNFITRGAISITCTMNGKSIRIINTHLANGVHNGYRYYQCKELIDFSYKENTSDATIICCDANSHTTEPEIKMLQSFFKNTYYVVNNIPAITWDNKNKFVKTGNLSEPDQYIDYIWLLNTSNASIVNSVIIANNPPLSDHYGVITIFSI